LPLRYHQNLSAAEAKAKVEAILDALELGSWAALTPSALGHSWQKRAGLARALALKPQVLLVDNALTGLDLRHANWWLDFLDQLSKGHRLLEGRPVTLVVTTADLRPWEGRAHQFAVLKGKRLEVLGTWAELEAASDELLHELLPKGRAAAGKT
jgi:ABC-type transporter Mla maintaining outer membrane lipid asymmetry ATPase subunit MlaF